MKLPVNWKLLNNKKLFLDYQRPAYKERDMETVKMIGMEMARRLRIKGLTKTKEFGWMATTKIAKGLEGGMIKERKDGSLVAVVNYIPIQDKNGYNTGKTKVDYTRFGQWLKS